MNQRIQLNDDTVQIIVKMTDGNPGAMNVCVELVRNNEQIDPDAGFGPLNAILYLDQLGLYGAKIWMLYKDVCGSDLPKMIALLRAEQLGFVTEEQVRHAVDNYGEGINLQDICSKVAERLPNFQMGNPEGQ